MMGLSSSGIERGGNMALRTIRVEGDPLLRKKSRKVETIDERIWELLDDMRETMVHADGIGLAAPQVGVLRRVVVIDIGDGPIEMINPEIIRQDGSVRVQEGCLSVPDKMGFVVRPESLAVRYLDRDGNEVTLDADDLLAVAVCHELDHLDGVLYIDKATGIQMVTTDQEV